MKKKDRNHTASTIVLYEHVFPHVFMVKFR